MVNGDGTPHGFDALGGPAWSPDSRLLLFERQDCPPGGDCSNSLFVVNSDGTGLTLLERSRSLSGFEWSPTQRTLAVEHSNAVTGISEVTIADLRRHGARLELSPVRSIRSVLGAFLWTPDGRAIIYESDGVPWIVDARRAQLRRRLPVPAYVSSLTWSPDGRWLAFSQSRGVPIEVATAAGRNRHTVTRKICCLLDELAWAPR